MSIEFIGMVHHRRESEIHPAGAEVMDLDFIRRLARAHDEGGFDKVLVGYYGHAPDGLLIGHYIAAHTSRLGVLIAHRPGFVAPPLAARKFATLDHLAGGRTAIHFVSGGDDPEQRRDGDWLDKEGRYRRTDEYLTVLKSLWTSGSPVSHDGEFYRFENASVAVRPLQQPHPPIYFGGASDAAIDVAGKHAEVYALWGETLEQTAELVGRVRQAAARYGRTLRFSISFRPILAETEQAAWRRADEILEAMKATRATGILGPGQGQPAAIGSQRLLAAAAKGKRVDKCLWTEPAALTGARGNSTALVGTPDQVADAMLDYYDLGITTFLVRGFDQLGDAQSYGRDLLPRLRALVAERDRSFVAPAAAQ